MNSVITVFFLSLMAGMGTGLGGLIAVIRKPGPSLYGFLMGITTGVMITLSFLELVNEAWRLQGFLVATIGFGSGAVVILIFDITFPHIRFGLTEIPHLELPSDEHTRFSRCHGHHGFRRWITQSVELDQALLRSGILIAVGITIHNIPEGIAVGAGYMHEPNIGYTNAFLHVKLIRRGV
jgi:ZIP family zinc transporter